MFYLQPRLRRSNHTPASKQNLETFRQFDEIFDRFFGLPQPQSPKHTHSSGQLKETEKEVTISLDAPGFEASEFDIQVNEEALVISAEHVVKNGEDSVTERSLKRQIALPAPVDPNKVEAKYRNGVLELRLTKAEQVQWRKVTVAE